VKLSIKHAPIGKVAKDFDFATLTRNWLGVDIAPLDLVGHITSGLPFSVAQYVDGYRKAKNFIASDIIALDIDSGADHQTPLTEAEYPSLLNVSEVETRKNTRNALSKNSVAPLFAQSLATRYTKEIAILRLQNLKLRVSFRDTAQFTADNTLPKRILADAYWVNFYCFQLLRIAHELLVYQFKGAFK
jgi:hypothetical protein